MGAADFLFTPSMQRVLTAILSDPDRTHTLEELLSLAAAGRGNTQRQIERLVASGVLKEEPRRGRQRSIKANTDYFLYQELNSIARKTFGVAEPLRAALRRFGADIHEAFVFGSVARGTDTERSDVDLVVVGTASLLDLSLVMDSLEQEIGRRVHLSMYGPDEWRELLAQDSIVREIAHGPRLHLLPDAKTS